MSLDDLPYLVDHRVRDAVVLPAAAYIDMALSAAHEAFGSEPSLCNIVLKEVLVLAEDQATTLQLIIAPDKPGTATFQILSRRTGDDSSAWLVNAGGLLQFDSPERPAPVDMAVIKDQCQTAVSAGEHYQAMRTRGLEYGPGFQGVQQVQRGTAAAWGEVQLPQALQSSASGYRLHPALLDACFQVLVATEVCVSA